MQTLAGKTTEVMGGLKAISDLLKNPDIHSRFEMNAAMLINLQVERITELENAAENFSKDVVSNSDIDLVLFVRSFNEWMKSSKERYAEKVKVK